MDTKNFFRTLLPDAGVYFTATPAAGGNGWINTAHDSIDAMVDHVNRLTFEVRAAYFAMAAYAQDKYFDPEFQNADGTKGKWRTRTQSNAQRIRCFYLDLDIDPADDKKFPSREVALAEFEAFRLKLQLPQPMRVNSGGGYHLYWPLTEEVPTEQWRITAQRFKDVCISEGFRADRSLTSDQARVLRALGSFNVRRGHWVSLEQTCAPIAFHEFKAKIDAFVDANGIKLTKPKAVGGLELQPGGVDLGDNIGAANDPINLGRVAFYCAQVGQQVGTRGAHAGEQLWRAALGIAKFCEPAQDAYRAVSDGHPDYDEGRTVIKIAQWQTGPTTCSHFHQENPVLCEACPHWQKLTSPAQLGREIREAPAPTITLVDVVSGAEQTIKLPDPPPGYKRRTDGAILIQSEDSEGNPMHVVVSPYDFYPTRILRQSGSDHSVAERSMWRVHLPRIAPQDIELEQSVLADGKKLHALLLSKGLHLIPEHAKAIQPYMSLYLQRLAAEADREKLYERLGWHNDHNEFVLGNIVLAADGTVRTHQPSRTVRAATKDSVRSYGSLVDWANTIQFYNRPSMEGHRFFLYAAFGAPLFHMNDTNNRGVLMTATGESGRGKTTCLMACASVWGHPVHLIMNGNNDGSTTNAMYESLATFHSLPFLWDDITERDPDEMRRILLNISQGSGKLRMHNTGQLNDKVREWETIVLASANTDEISKILATGQNVEPHLMRYVGVEFSLISSGPEAKIKADKFIRELGANYGHAGPVFMKYVAQHYALVRQHYIDNVAKIDRLLGSHNASAERFWSATVAAAYTGAQIAVGLGLLKDFPIDADLLWMVKMLGQQRTSIGENRTTPLETLAEFLERHVSNTLVVSPKAASNLDNVVCKPTGQLVVRHELDTGNMYVMKSTIREYCTEHKTIPFRKLEVELAMAGVIVDVNAQKVLGAETPFAKGQSRCWRIDTSKLGPKALAAVTTAQASAVTPIAGGKAA